MNTLTRLCVFGTLLLFVISCNTEDNLSNGQNTVVISGNIQKGPFIKGSSVTGYALDDNLDALGLVYPTLTLDDMGYFQIGNISSNYIDITVKGKYYSESKGEVSNNEINLQAISNTKKTVNVNVLTTLAYKRIKYLVRNGMTFKEAEQQARNEILKIFWVEKSVSSNFTDLNIFGSGEANGILLAASLIIENDREGTDMGKLIAEIADDIETDGELSETLFTELFSKEKSIKINEVIDNTLSFCKNNKVAYSIPPFYKYLELNGDNKLDGNSDIFLCLGTNEILYGLNRGYNANAFSTKEIILSTTPFKVGTDADWLSIESNELCENIYTVTVSGQQNTGEIRNANVIFTDYSGNELKIITYQQRAAEELSHQRFVFYDIENVPSTINFNQRSYPIHQYNEDVYEGARRLSYKGDYYVDIPKEEVEDEYLVYFPNDVVSMTEERNKYIVTLPSYWESNIFPRACKVDKQNIFNLVAACPCFSINVESLQCVDYLEIISREQLCGKATYDVENFNKCWLDYNSSSLSADGYYKMTVKVSEGSSQYVFYVPTLKSDNKATIMCYDKNGNMIRKINCTSYYYPMETATRIDGIAEVKYNQPRTNK